MPTLNPQSRKWLRWPGAGPISGCPSGVCGIGPLTVRYAPHADAILERLAAEHRDRESVLLVTSDAAVRGTSGQEVRHRASRTFLDELASVSHTEGAASRLGDRLDDETRARLERLRRGEG